MIGFSRVDGQKKTRHLLPRTIEGGGCLRREVHSSFWTSIIIHPPWSDPRKNGSRILYSQQPPLLVYFLPRVLTKLNKKGQTYILTSRAIPYAHTPEDFRLHIPMVGPVIREGKGEKLIWWISINSAAIPKRMSDVFRTRDGWGKKRESFTKVFEIMWEDEIGRRTLLCFCAIPFRITVPTCRWFLWSCLLFLLGWSPHIYQRMEHRGAIDQYQKFGQQTKKLED